MNVRSVEGKRKQEQLQQAISGMCVDIWLLSETKLTKAAHFEGYFIQQTTSSTKGGCVTLVDRRKITRMKLVKTLGEYFNWTKVQLRDGTGWIHLISCYLEGGE